MEEIGGYRLVRRLGAGGMGTVWAALNGDNQEVALKLLHPHIARDPSARARLAREVELLHRVRGRGVARVVDAEVEDDDAFVVTELIEGPTLEEDVAADGAFSGVELAGLAQGLADALASIHRVGVVHRDLKPGNVMMSPAGPVLIDFGIAQVADDTRLTQTGMVTGTPGYLDPEVIEGAPPTESCDWWAWAAVLVFAATGRKPFGTGPALTVIKRMADGALDLAGIEPVAATALWAALQPSHEKRLDSTTVLAVLEGRLDERDLGEALAALGLHNPLAVPRDDDGNLVFGQEEPEEIPPAIQPVRIDSTRVMPADGSTELLGTSPDATEFVDRDALDPAPGYPGPATEMLPAVPAPPPAAYGAPPLMPGAYPHYGGTDPQGWNEPAAPSSDYPDMPYRMPPPRPPAQTYVVASVGALLVAGAALWPGVSALALAVLTFLSATVGFSARDAERRALRFGPRRGDALRTLGALPWHLLRAALTTAVRAILAGVFLWVMVTVLAPVSDRLETSTILWVAAGVAMLWMWWGPGGSVGREGARVAIREVFPFTAMRVVLALVCVGFAVLAVLFAVEGDYGVTWAPLPPDLVPYL